MKSVCSALGVARSNLHVRHHRSGHWQDNRRGRTPAQDGLLLADLRRHIAGLPSYGYRRAGALLNRERRSQGQHALTDSDGDFKVITMQRLFMNASRDSLQQLHGELAQCYASAIKADIAMLKLDGIRIQLSFMHPIMFQDVGAGADEASKLFLALWQQGWMEFKGKNAGLLGAMNTITNHNKSSIAACKPKMLSLD